MMKLVKEGAQGGKSRKGKKDAGFGSHPPLLTSSQAAEGVHTVFSREKSSAVRKRVHHEISGAMASDVSRRTRRAESIFDAGHFGADTHLSSIDSPSIVLAQPSPQTKGKGLATDFSSPGAPDIFIPNWNISSQNSILHDGVGHTSLAMARGLALPQDREILARMGAKELEEKASQCLLETLLYVRRLAESEKVLLTELLKWKKLANQGEEARSQYRALKLQLKEVQVELDQAKKLARQLEEDKAAAKERYIRELDSLSGKILNLKLKGQETLEEGKRLGRSEYLSSEEYQAALKAERRVGVSTYRRSKAYKRAIDTATAEFYTDGFWQCRDRVQNHISFPPRFDLSFLAHAQNACLEQYADTIISDVESEYANLSEVESNGSNRTCSPR